MCNIELTSASSAAVAEGTYVYIDANAAMPELRAKLAVDPGFQVEWQIQITYGRNGRNDNDSFPANPRALDGNSSWHLNPDFGNDIRGGEAVITVRGTGANNNFTCQRSFHIRGTNPTDASVETALTNAGALWYVQAIGRHESFQGGAAAGNRHYNQFNEIGATNAGANDVLNTPNASNDGGFGIFQLTNIGTAGRAPTAQELWSWRANLTTAVAETNRHQTNANNWMNAAVGAAGYANGGQRTQAANENQGTAVPVPNRVVQNVTFADGTNHTIEHAVAIKMFNGAATNYCFWRNTTATVPGSWQFNNTNHLNIDYVDRVCGEV